MLKTENFRDVLVSYQLSQKAEISENAEDSNFHLFFFIFLVVSVVVYCWWRFFCLFVCYGALNKSIKTTTYWRHYYFLLVLIEQSTLDLVVIELIFITVAFLVLCFGAVMKSRLIIHWWFSCCWVALTQSQGLCFSCCLANKLSVHKKMGGDSTRTADPYWPKECPMPYCIMLNDIKQGNEGRRTGILSDPVCLPKKLSNMTCGYTKRNW